MHHINPLLLNQSGELTRAAYVECVSQRERFDVVGWNPQFRD
jgi:hypothetical protein